MASPAFDPTRWSSRSPLLNSKRRCVWAAQPCPPRVADFFVWIIRHDNICGVWGRVLEWCGTWGPPQTWRARGLSTELINTWLNLGSCADCRTWAHIGTGLILAEEVGLGERRAAHTIKLCLSRTLPSHNQVSTSSLHTGFPQSWRCWNFSLEKMLAGFYSIILFLKHIFLSQLWTTFREFHVDLISYSNNSELN